MPVPALLLILLAACLHVGWNALTKRSRHPFVFLWMAMSLGSLLLAIPAGFVLLRQAPDPLGWAHAAASAAVHAVYFFTLSRAYRAGDLSLVYPVSRGLSIALVAVLAWPLVGEPPRPLGSAGVLLVIAGVVLVAQGRLRPSGAPLKPLETASGARPGWLTAGLGWAVLTGLCVTAYSLIDKRGTVHLAPLPYLVTILLGSCLLLTPLALQRRDALREEWQANGRTIVLAAAFSGLAYLLVLHAMQRAPVSYVVAAREVSIVLSVVIGRLWMSEPTSPRRMAGAAVIVAGVFCLALAR